jgi:hypothetical protein
MSLFLCLNLVVLLVSASLHGDCYYTNYEAVVYKYLNDIESRNSLIFYSDYKYKEGDKEESISLVIEFGKSDGLMVERMGCVVTNVASISFSPSHNTLVVSETDGGVYSYNRAGTLLRNFLKEHFGLLRAEGVKAILRIRSPEKQ